MDSPAHADAADTDVFVFRSVLPVPPAQAFAWHERPDALLDLMPSPRLARIEHQSGGLRDGGRVVFSLGLGPLRLRWEARHFGYIPGEQFCDEQVRGPFRIWRHTHRFEPVGPDRTRYEDRIELALPGPPVLRRLARPALRLLLTRAFAERHRVVRNSLTAAP